MSESKEIGVMITNMNKSWSDEEIIEIIESKFDNVGIPISVDRYKNDKGRDPHGEIIEFVIRRTHKEYNDYVKDDQPAHEHLKETE